jgi:hypothetical protein
MSVDPCPWMHVPAPTSLDPRPWTHVPAPTSLDPRPWTHVPGCTSLGARPEFGSARRARGRAAVPAAGPTRDSGDGPAEVSRSHVPGPMSLDPCPWMHVRGPMSLDARPWTHVPGCTSLGARPELGSARRARGRAAVPAAGPTRDSGDGPAEVSRSHVPGPMSLDPCPWMHVPEPGSARQARGRLAVAAACLDRYSRDGTGRRPGQSGRGRQGAARR